jgi:hypothetical protein
MIASLLARLFNVLLLADCNRGRAKRNPPRVRWKGYKEAPATEAPLPPMSSQILKRAPTHAQQMMSQLQWIYSTSLSTRIEESQRDV